MTPSNVDPIDDYEALIACLNKHGADYIIVGAYAVGHHGFVRATVDLDILVKPSPENAVKVSAALKDFIGVDVDSSELSREKARVQLGRYPNGLDIITSITGVAWDKAWVDRIRGRFGKQATQFLSKENLVQNKRSAGRDKDHLDLQGLGVEKVEQKSRSKARRPKGPKRV